jgi:hypothetical protein
VIADTTIEGVLAGITVFVILTVPVYIVQSGTLGGTALGVLVLSPLAVFVGSGTAGFRTTASETGGRKTGIKQGLVTGFLLGLMPALIAARFGYGLASLGENVIGTGGLLVSGIVLGILLLSGLVGGLSGGLLTIVGERVQRRLSSDSSLNSHE